jgi:hypothetical protein
MTETQDRPRILTHAEVAKLPEFDHIRVRTIPFVTAGPNPESLVTVVQEWMSKTGEVLSDLRTVYNAERFRQMRKAFIETAGFERYVKDSGPVAIYQTCGDRSHLYIHGVKVGDVDIKYASYHEDLARRVNAAADRGE